MRELLRNLAVLSPLAVTTLIASVIQGKALAELLGPEGSGRFFLAAAFFSLATTLAAVGIHSAMTKLVSEFRGAQQFSLLWDSVHLGLLTVTATSALLIAVSAVFSEQLGELFLGGLEPSADRRFIVLVSAIAMVPASWGLVMLGFLRGLGRVRVYAVAGSLMAVLTVVTVVGGAAWGGFRGAFLGAVAAQSLSVVVLGLAAVRNAPRRRSPRRIFTSTAAKLESRVLFFGLLAVVAALAGSLGHTASRSYLASTLDLRAVGFFAAAWSITNRLPTLLYQTFSVHLVPTISSLGKDWRRISDEQNNALRLSLLAATPVLAVAIVATPLVIHILLSSEFLPMSDLLRVMLFGELLSLVYWATGIALYPSGRPLASAICEWSWWLLFGLGLLVLTQSSGLLGAGYAYAGSYGVMATAIYMAERRRGHLRWTRSNVRLLALSVGTLFVVTTVSAAASGSTMILILMLAAVLSAWPFLGLTAKERVRLHTALRRRAAR